MVNAWQNYIQSLAEANNMTAHGRPDGLGRVRNTFMRYNDFLEAEAATISSLHTPFVVCGPIDGKPVGHQPALRKKLRTVLYFLGHVATSGTPFTDRLELVQQQTYDLMMEFITRFLRDYDEQGACGPFSKIDPNSMLFMQVGPHLQNDYGWRLQMEFLENGPEFLYDPSKWTP